MGYFNMSMTNKEFIYALRDGVSTVDLVNRSGDPKAVIRALRMGVEVDRLKQIDGIYRAVLKLPYDHPCAKCGIDLYNYDGYDDIIIRFHDEDQDEVCEKCFDKKPKQNINETV